MIEIQEQGLNRIFLENCFFVEAASKGGVKMSILENNNTDKSDDNKQQMVEDFANDQEERIVHIKQEQKEENFVEQQAQSVEANQMNPIETATLLLLSRIAFFNKVK